MISCVALCLNAYAQTELDNLGLETWTTSDSERYEEPDYPWKTANFGVDFDLLATTNPVTKVTDAHSGDYAAKMESATIFFTFTAGALWTGDFEINLNDFAKSAKFGVPYEGTPTNLHINKTRLLTLKFSKPKRLTNTPYSIWNWTTI